MFLLNSLLLLVTATCDPVKDHRHPLYLRYRAIVAEFPKLSLLRRLLLLREGHLCRF